jgi:hypothetical protein
MSAVGPHLPLLEFSLLEFSFRLRRTARSVARLFSAALEESAGLPSGHFVSGGKLWQ